VTATGKENQNGSNQPVVMATATSHTISTAAQQAMTKL